MHIHLAFVVAGSASVDALILDDRLERRRRPQLQRVGRLHVVVTVYEYGRLARVDNLVAIHDGVAVCLTDFDIVGTGLV